MRTSTVKSLAMGWLTLMCVLAALVLIDGGSPSQAFARTHRAVVKAATTGKPAHAKARGKESKKHCRISKSSRRHRCSAKASKGHSNQQTSKTKKASQKATGSVTGDPFSPPAPILRPAQQSSTSTTTVATADPASESPPIGGQGTSGPTSTAPASQTPEPPTTPTTTTEPPTTTTTPPPPTSTSSGTPTSPPAPSAEKLRWAPPTLVKPTTINLGTGYTHTLLSNKRDYIIKLPSTKKIGATWLDGGHNIVMIGGYVTVPTGTEPGVANDAQRTAIYIKGATGTVHIEGVQIDGSGGAEFDGVDIDAPLATVQLENMRIIGVKGRFSAFHGDMVQPWGGVKDLRIDHLTGTSNYQGLTLQPDLGPIGSAEISNVDLAGTTEPPLDLGGHLIWLTTDSDTCTGFPVSFSNVYLQPREGLTFPDSVWPAGNSDLECKESGGTFATWPSLSVTGGVQDGTPPGGSFVPPGAAGIGYVSPGYSES
jgi:hypothetical protein